MKQISEELAEHLSGETTTLAMCWKLIRRDGVVSGYTEHDRDIEYDGVIYRAATGFTPSAVQNSGSIRVDNLEIEGMLADDGITEMDIHAGLYDFAEVDIFLLNYWDTSQGMLKLRRGWLGEVSFHKQHFVAEVRGLTQRLSQTIGELYSASCRATLGDSRCKVNLAAHTVAGSVSAVTSRQHFSDSGRSEASGVFTFGMLTFTTGANAGLRMEVKEYVHASTGGGQCILALPMPYEIAIGDGYSLTKGCDKTIATCHARFGNMVNFRGEPAVPGLDRMLETAGTRSQW